MQTDKAPALMRRIIGFDPGLVATGWGIVESDGHRLDFIACGVIMPDKDKMLSYRLYQLYQQAYTVLEQYQPKEAALEESFVNRNPASTLKLGTARGVLLMLPHLFGANVSEYHNRTIKKALSGSGRADKTQIHQMVLHLLPAAKTQIARHDAADALAIAITHAHSQLTQKKWSLS